MSQTLSRSLFKLFQVLALVSFASTYQPQNLIVVGGGAAGLFGAINACERAKSLGKHIDCVVFEQGPKPLSKVRISGGGRCNVMHDDTKSPEELANTGYPRGSRELLGPITSRFGAVEASSWFRSRGVALKTESDGRMFPVSDNSETIAECLLDAAQQAGVRIVTQCKVTDVRRACGEEEADTHRGRAGGAVPLSTSGGREGQDASEADTGVSPMFEVDVKIGGSSTSSSSRSGTKSETFQAHMVLVSPGASKQAWAWLERMGHPIEPPVPSLFTLTLEECRKNDAAGAPLLPARGGGGRVGDHEEEETEKGGGEGGVEAPTSAREAAPWLADLAGVTVPYVTLTLLDTPPPATTARAQAPAGAVGVSSTGKAGGNESSGGECARRGSGTDVSSGGGSVDDDAAAAKEQTEGKTKKRRNNNKKKKKAKKAKALVVRSGPLLLTHSGISGPAALRLSAWGARHLANSNYRANVMVNWCSSSSRSSSSIAGGGGGGGGGSGGGEEEGDGGGWSFDNPGEAEAALAGLLQSRPELGSKSVATFCPWRRRRPSGSGDGSGSGSDGSGEPLLPKRLWHRLVTERAGLAADRKWSGVTAHERRQLAGMLTACPLRVAGKGAFKDEFVTCGGVALKSVDLRAMQSKRVPGLFFAGEVLDVDGVTGGFNFQSCWTTGFIAGAAIGKVASAAETAPPPPPAI